MYVAWAHAIIYGNIPLINH